MQIKKIYCEFPLTHGPCGESVDYEIRHDGQVLSVCKKHRDEIENTPDISRKIMNYIENKRFD